MSKAWFSLHGVGLRCQSTLPRATDLVMRELGPYKCHRLSEANISIRIDAASSPLKKEIEQNFHWQRSRPLWGNHVGGHFQITDGQSWASSNLATGELIFELAEETLTDELFFARTFFLLPLLEMLRAFGFFYVHGALVTKESRACLIVGSGGSGKSTLAASLLRSGWQIVADDNLLLSLGQEGKVIAQPLEQELSLSHQACQLLSLPTLTPPITGKCRIPLGQLPGHWVAKNAAPTHILMLSPNPKEPLTRQDVLTQMLNDNPTLWTNPDLAQEHMNVLGAMIRQVTCHRLPSAKVSPLSWSHIAAPFLNAFDSSWPMERGLTYKHHQR